MSTMASSPQPLITSHRRQTSHSSSLLAHTAPSAASQRGGLGPHTSGGSRVAGSSAATRIASGEGSGKARLGSGSSSGSADASASISTSSHTPLSAITNRARSSLTRGSRSSFSAQTPQDDDDSAAMPPEKRASRSSMAPPTSKSARYGALQAESREGSESATSRQSSMTTHGADRNGPRKPSAIGGPSSRMASIDGTASNASFSGGQRIPSVLRRLPPGASAPRSAAPSGTYHSDPDGSFQHPSSSSASSSGSGIPPRAAGVSALARANQRGPRVSLGASINAAANGGVVQHDRDGREIVKLTVDSTSFEEWMKMATDNKINATNTWNFALIDYFHDMSLLRSDNGDGSINFQKASCTLDGCVKVWTSRVDSVVVETGKLLSGLQDDGKDAQRGRGRRGADDEEGEGGEEGEEEGTGTGRKKRSRAKEPTLVKNFSQIAVKKLDLEFTVDPLFKKTSADFDEGGAGGLLMNHLGVDSNACVIFDASDVPGQDDVNADGVAEGDDASDVTETGARPEVHDEQEPMVDLNKIRNKFFGQYEPAGEEDAVASFLGGMTICPTFAVFRFAPGDNTPFSNIVNAPREDVEFGTPSDFGGSQGWNDDFNDGPGFDDDGLDDAFGGPNLGSGGGLFDTGDSDPFAIQGDGFDGADFEANDVFGGAPSSSKGPVDFTQSLQGLADGAQPLDGDDFFGYFDQRLTKNWAGPEHWKMRNMNVGGTLGGVAGAGGAGDKPIARKSKEPFVIDFTSAEGAVTSRELFETARGGTGTLLPPAKDGVEDLHLLPEDRHFSSKQLMRLFIKPRATLSLRRRRAGRDGPDGRGDTETARWLHGQGIGDNEDGVDFTSTGLGFDGDDGAGEMPEMPFDTQFFHEEDGAFEMDEGAERAMALEPEDEEELATQALKRIRPEFVNYAKKAKRVDIRKLKENIWKELGIKVDVDAEEESEDEEEGDESSVQAAVKLDPMEPRTFETVLSGLRKLYSKDKMEEISTSFCFICLLHLANEEGLRIKPQALGSGAGLGMLTNQPIVEDDEEEGAEDAPADEDDDGDVPRSLRRSTTTAFTTPAKQLSEGRRGRFLGVHDGEDDEQGLENVNFLEQLSIAKDPNAGRSA